METSLEVQSLVASAKAGDREAFRVLYHLLAPKVFRFVRPRARSREEALDVLQETFIDFWKRLSSFSYQGSASLDAYLYRIAVRKQYRFFRWWGQSASLESFDDVFVSEAEGDTTTMVDVLRAIQKLSGVDREIIILRHIEGRSFPEIAGLLKKSENALKVRHHRAIDRLRKSLRYD